MVKTTVYLEGEVALALRQIAKTKGRSQAELIREALDDYTRQHQRPPIPGVGEFRSSEPGVSVRAEEILREGGAMVEGHQIEWPLISELHGFSSSRAQRQRYAAPPAFPSPHVGRRAPGASRRRAT